MIDRVMFVRAGLVLAGLVLLATTVSLPTAAVELFPLDQVQPGMKATARTIFAGKEIELFEMEVIGVLRNLIGPQQDLILVRLLGERVNYTGVVAGMSGSPVYIDGKLVGALGFRFGVFTKEPIAGITPIESMLRAAQQEDRVERAEDTGGLPPRYPLPEESATALGLSHLPERYLTPIETPVSFVGIHPQVVARFSAELADQGLLAVQGGGTAIPLRTSDLVPGGAVSAALVTGDMGIAATCTITHRVGDQLYACGHWLLNYGDVQLPMAQAEIVTTVPSELASFKLANLGELVGTFHQDRRSAIVGQVGPLPPMVPVTLTLAYRGRERRYHYQIFQHPKISPLLFNVTLFNGLFATIESGAELTYRVSGRLHLRDHTDVVLDDMFSPTDTFIPDAFFVANSVGQVFRQVFTNPFERPTVESIQLRVELLPQRRSATLENAWADKSEARPGETIQVKVVLRPYRGERIVRQIPIVIPAQAVRGDLRILVSDANTLNRISRTLLFGAILHPQFNFGPRVSSLEQLIALLNRERRNDQLFFAVLQRAPTLLVEEKILPSVPLSQANVLNRQSAPGTPGGPLLFYESILSESSEPIGQVTSGSQWLQITVR